jgi:hypothetical protein
MIHQEHGRNGWLALRPDDPNAAAHGIPDLESKSTVVGPTQKMVTL